jgi:hypothetical protein
LVEKQKQIMEIVDFVKRNKGSYASHTVCARVLGEDYFGINSETIVELRDRLPQIDDEEIEACYYIIK